MILKTIWCCWPTLLVEVISLETYRCIKKTYIEITKHRTQFSIHPPQSSSTHLLMVGLRCSLWEITLNESTEVNSVNNPFINSDIRSKIWFTLCESSWMNHRQWIVQTAISLNVPPQWRAVACSLAVWLLCFTFLFENNLLWVLSGTKTTHNWR